MKIDIEELNEELSEFGDREIVAEVLDLLTPTQLNKLVKRLKENY